MPVTDPYYAEPSDRYSSNLGRSAALQRIDAPFAKLLQGAIQTAVEEAVKEVVDRAKAEVETKVRGQVGQIAARILEKFSFEKFGQELVIRVEFPKT